MAETKGTSASSSGQRQQNARNEQRPQGQAMQRRQPRGEESMGFADVFGGGPLHLMRRMSEEMDRAFERMFGDLGFGRGMSRTPFGEMSMSRPAMWAPRIEAFQKDDQFIVRAELPGLKKDDVEVNVTEDAITIQGQRQEEHERKQEGFYHNERSYGSFYRTIPLPEGVITDSADASFKDGVLEIRLQAPPNEVSRGRRLEIKDQSEQGRQK